MAFLITPAESAVVSSILQQLREEIGIDDWCDILYSPFKVTRVKSRLAIGLREIFQRVDLGEGRQLLTEQIQSRLVGRTAPKQHYYRLRLADVLEVIKKVYGQDAEAILKKAQYVGQPSDDFYINKDEDSSHESHDGFAGLPSMGALGKRKRLDAEPEEDSPMNEHGNNDNKRRGIMQRGSQHENVAASEANGSVDKGEVQQKGDDSGTVDTCPPLLPHPSNSSPLRAFSSLPAATTELKQSRSPPDSSMRHPKVESLDQLITNNRMSDPSQDFATSDKHVLEEYRRLQAILALKTEVIERNAETRRLMEEAKKWEQEGKDFMKKAKDRGERARKLNETIKKRDEETERLMRRISAEEEKVEWYKNPETT